MKKTKIAFITPLYLPAKLSGSIVTIQNSAEELAQRGVDCSIITSQALNTRFWYDPFSGKKTDKKFDRINGVKIYRLGCYQPISIFALIMVRFFRPFLPKRLYDKFLLLHSGPILKGLKPLLDKEKFTAIYISPLPTHLTKQALKIAQEISPRPKTILGARFHASLKDYLNPEFGKFIRNYDFIHVLTKEEKNDMKKIFAIPDHKFIIFPDFLRLQVMKEASQLKSEAKNFRRKFKLKDKKIILFVGGKTIPKGIYTLVEAVDQLTVSGLPLILITIGDNRHSLWQKYLREKQPKFIIDLGYVNEHQKEVVFTAADIYCMPSICESFGLTYLEAWQKAKPVIGANIPVVKGLIHAVSGGLVVKFGNSKQLAKTIKKLIQNPKLIHELGQNGQQAVKNVYNFQKLMPKLKILFALK